MTQTSGGPGTPELVPPPSTIESRADSKETFETKLDANRFTLNEDWAATIVGLVLLGLVLAGVITGSLVGSFVPTLVAQ